MEELEEMKEAQRVDGMMIDAFEHERKEEVAVLGSLIQKIHRGLVKANGYVDEEEFEDGEWQRLHSCHPQGTVPGSSCTLHCGEFQVAPCHCHKMDSLS